MVADVVAARAAGMVVAAPAAGKAGKWVAGDLGLEALVMAATVGVWVDSEEVDAWVAMTAVVIAAEG